MNIQRIVGVYIYIYRLIEGDFILVSVLPRVVIVLGTEPRFRKYRSLVWISKRRTGFVKHGLIKRGFIKHESVKHGSMDKTCFINRCFTNPCFINPFFKFNQCFINPCCRLVHVLGSFLLRSFVYPSLFCTICH